MEVRVNKKYFFSYCSSLNKEYLVHQYSFKIKWFNCLYLLFLKAFMDFILFLRILIYIFCSKSV